jgi:hypothetical protein
MNTATIDPASRTPSFPAAILWGGLICGTLDLSSALIDAAMNFKMGPTRLLQNVAGALLGPNTYNDGAASAALGFVLHFTVAFTATTIFYLLSRRFPLLVKWAVPSGLVYGAIVFFAMYRGVIPLTIQLKSLYLTTFNHAFPQLKWSQFIIHLFCVGLAISLSVRYFGPQPEMARK